MKRFAALYETLDATNSTRAKVDAIAAYLHEAPPADAAWGVYFLAGGTVYRIHGTNAAETIGGAVSSGCIRMLNNDVIDLYGYVKVGSPVYVYQ